MESRKAWRNREAGVNDEVLGLLEALRQGLGAERVALFDDDRGDPLGSSDGLAFWDVFDEPRCAAMDWQSWYRALRTDARVSAACGCTPCHRVDGFLVHGRWALVLIGPAAVPATDAAAVTSALRALTNKLPPSRSHLQAPLAEREREEERRARRDEHAQHADSAAASGGALFWVRKLRQ